MQIMGMKRVGRKTSGIFDNRNIHMKSNSINSKILDVEKHPSFVVGRIKLKDLPTNIKIREDHIVVKQVTHKASVAVEKKMDNEIDIYESNGKFSSFIMEVGYDNGAVKESFDMFNIYLAIPQSEFVKYLSPFHALESLAQESNVVDLEHTVATDYKYTFEFIDNGKSLGYFKFNRDQLVIYNNVNEKIQDIFLDTGRLYNKVTNVWESEQEFHDKKGNILGKGHLTKSETDGTYWLIYRKLDGTGVMKSYMVEWTHKVHSNFQVSTYDIDCNLGISALIKPMSVKTFEYNETLIE